MASNIRVKSIHLSYVVVYFLPSLPSILFINLSLPSRVTLLDLKFVISRSSSIKDSSLGFEHLFVSNLFSSFKRSNLIVEENPSLRI